MIYFDNAATTWQKPPCVGAAITRALSECGGNPGRAGHRLSLAAAEGIEHARETLSSLLGVFPAWHTVFCGNATAALNMALYTRVRRGDHILISDREHNAVYRPVCRLAREGIADFDVFSTHGNVTDSIRSLLRKETRILICNHVSNVDGAVAPMAAIGKLCRENGIYFIADIAQSVGHMPLCDLCDTADVLCGPGHKGLFGIQGCGFAWFRNKTNLREFLSGGSGSASREVNMPTTLPEKFEAGTLPTPAIFALAAGAEFVQKITPNAIAAHESELGVRLHERLSALPGIHSYYGGCGGVLSFTARQMGPDDLAAALDARGICVRAGLHCAPLAHAAIGTAGAGSVRVSFSYFNTAAEVDTFVRTLTDILA